MKTSNHPISRSAWLAAALAASLTASACTTPVVVDGPAAAAEQVTRPVRVAPDWIWSASSVPVCWVDPEAGTPAQRLLVRQAVASTWEAASSVRFVGWGGCADETSPGVRIRIRDAVPSHLVRALDMSGWGEAFGRHDSVTLNITFEEWNPSCQDHR